MAGKKSEIKKQIILRAALDAFSEKGFADTRMDDIAARARVAKGTLYLYFPSKEALLSAIANHEAAQLHAAVEAVAAEPGLTLRDKLEKVLTPILDERSEDPTARVLRLLWSEGLRRPELVSGLLERFVEPMIIKGELFRGLQSDEKLPEAVQRYPMLLIAPAIHGILWKGIYGKAITLDLKEFYGAYLDMIFPPSKS